MATLYNCYIVKTTPFSNIVQISANRPKNQSLFIPADIKCTHFYTLYIHYKILKKQETRVKYLCLKSILKEVSYEISK